MTKRKCKWEVDDESLRSRDYKTPADVQALVVAAMHVSADEAQQLQHIDQHDPLSGEANPAWLAARKPAGLNRVTGSTVSHCIHGRHVDAAGKSDASNRPELQATRMIRDNFIGCAATEWGNQNEDLCRDVVMVFLARKLRQDDDDVAHVACEELGIVLRTDLLPLCGYSPDGVVRITYHSGRPERRVLLELKCPWSKRKDPYQEGVSKYAGYYFDHDPDRPLIPIKEEYMDQVQLGMKMLGLSETFFGVWTPFQTQIFSIQAQPEYVSSFMVPRIEAFYWNIYIPTYVCMNYCCEADALAMRKKNIDVTSKVFQAAMDAFRQALRARAAAAADVSRLEEADFLGCARAGNAVAVAAPAANAGNAAASAAKAAASAASSAATAGRSEKEAFLEADHSVAATVAATAVETA